MKNIFVAGGTGFVGAHVCEKLARLGWQVTVPTRRLSHADHLQHLPSLTALELDVFDDAALLHAVAGHDAVVNLVAILHGTEAEFDKVHVDLPQKLARACIAARVKKMVHISALGANAREPEAAPSMYLRSKGRGEAALMHVTSGAAGAAPAMELNILRPSVIFGAEDKFLNLFAKLEKMLPVLPLAGAHARFQPVWVEDVASAVLRCLELDGTETLGHAPRVVEACGPEVYTLKELVQLAAQLSGVHDGLGRPVIALPDWLGRLQATLMEWAPGAPVMSRDNLDSMRIDNVASGTLPGLLSLGITPAALKPIAQDYLAQTQPDYGLLGIRQRAHHG